MSLDLYIAVAAMCVTIIRAVFAITLNDRQNLYALIILTAILCVFMMFRIDHIVDLTILLANICIGLSCYYRDHFVKYRIATSISQILWIIHSLYFGVYSMLACCLMILGTSIGALLYYSPVGEAIMSKFMRKVKA